MKQIKFFMVDHSGEEYVEKAINAFCSEITSAGCEVLEIKPMIWKYGIGASVVYEKNDISREKILDVIRIVNEKA